LRGPAPASSGQGRCMGDCQARCWRGGPISCSWSFFFAGWPGSEPVWCGLLISHNLLRLRLVLNLPRVDVGTVPSHPLLPGEWLRLGWSGWLLLRIRSFGIRPQHPGELRSVSPSWRLHGRSSCGKAELLGQGQSWFHHWWLDREGLLYHRLSFHETATCRFRQAR